ncbi:VWA domain-containing protein, partial [Enterococcus faecalis]|nr:VWA domain-containing protein [Enterococcus faecalis]
TFQYDTTNTGNLIQNGIENGNTYNYAYNNVNNIPVDSEGYVNYQNRAFVKKTVKENPEKQGLFDITLDVKGNQIDHPLDILLIMDYSSSMTGEKLNNTLIGLREFGAELGDSLKNNTINIGIVAYNKNIYTTNGFTNDLSSLEDFLRNSASSHAGTFIQKGLVAGQKLIQEYSRPTAQKMMIHIGDGSANRSYLPTNNATSFNNNGEIIDYNGFHTPAYFKDFQTESDKFNTFETLSDPNATTVEKSTVTDATLGTIVATKELGYQMFSISTNPSARGEYIDENIADTPSHYHTIDENLSGLGEALKDIANSFDKTILNGTVTDPMGSNIMLQGTGQFTNSFYNLSGWAKDTNGNWISKPELLTTVVVNESDQVITLNNLYLGSNERITLTYQVRINTESKEFQGEYWYLCNQRTTLDPINNGEQLDFPIPSIKAPLIELSVEKHWKDTPKDKIPNQIDFQISRSPITYPETWSLSDTLSLKKEDNFTQKFSHLLINGLKANLPLYNNHGDTFIYKVQELNIPTGFKSTVEENNHQFVITNIYENSEPSSTTETTTDHTSNPTMDTTIPEESFSSSNLNSISSYDKKISISKQKKLPKTNSSLTSSYLFTLFGINIMGLALYLLKHR